MPDRNYSVENLFRAMLRSLPADCDATVHVSRHRSVGVRNRVLDVFEARTRQADVNHVAGDVHYLTYLLRRDKTLLTILDYNHVSRSPLRQWLFTLLWFHIPVRRAKLIAVISEFTRDEVRRVTGRNSSNIRVIPCCIDSSFVPRPHAFSSDRPVILQVGTNRNKNVERVAQALCGVPCTLHIVGTLAPSQRAALNTAGIEYWNSVGLSAEGIRLAYEKADMVSFPSTYEGFGLPIVEAQAVGRPVLTSAIRPMSDVAGGAACLVDPHDLASIRAGFLRIISDAEYRASLVENGFINAARYSANHIASLYADAYRELAGFEVSKRQDAVASSAVLG